MPALSLGDDQSEEDLAGPVWHCIGPAADFTDRRPHAVEAFGVALVAFADRAGEVHVLDARCPHMGGDLRHGIVSGDTVDCPVHRWCWDGRGRCVAGSPRPLPVRSWTTRVRAGLVYLRDHETNTARRQADSSADDLDTGRELRAEPRQI